MNGLSILEQAYLTQCIFLSRKKRLYLRDYYPTLAAIRVHLSEIMRILSIDRSHFLTFQRVLDSYDDRAFRNYLAEEKITVLSVRSKHYPLLLKEIFEPPSVLFARGNLSLLASPAISIVGTRKPTSYGITATGIIVRDIEGLVFVSGGAYGIDQLVHEQSLSEGKSSIVVLGMGFEQMQSNIRNNRIMKTNKENILFLSEYWPTMPATRFTFPERNRIISGLSRATIVVEAPRKSGALITAQCALDQNREVIAVPGPIFHYQSAGTNRLISEGAIPYTKEVIESIYHITQQVSEKERIVLEQLRSPCFMDDLAFNDRMNILSKLELSGLIKRKSDGRWVRI